MSQQELSTEAHPLTSVFLPSTKVLVVALLHALLLSHVSTIAGVTHWKLQDGSITPLETDLGTNSREKNADVLAVNLADSDPEFAILVRHTTKLPGVSGGGGATRKPRAQIRTETNQKGGSPTRSHCPVLTVDLNSNGVTSSVRERQRGRCKPAEGVGCTAGDVCKEAGQKRPRNPDGSGPMSPQAMLDAQPAPLTCGDSVETTAYDWLEGIARRHEHSHYPEPEVAMIFKKTESDNAVDLFEVEMGLRKAYQETPNSLTVLNQIGNFWRIKGNTQLAIECFRKALSLSPDHPDLLLNLARVLFNLKYNNDAVYLAKRSLHMKSSDHHVWLQYFTLGEVYKALEKYEEAAWYFKKTLELNPGLHVAELHLRELGLDQVPSINTYTVVIIFILICIVLALIYYLLGALDL